MIKEMRQSTLRTLGMGPVLDIFRNGSMPVDAGELVDEIFGKPGNRGSLVISGANGIVGAGKAMQLGTRLQPYDITVVGLDFPGTPDGIGKQFPGLVRAFGPEQARKVMGNIIRLTYDGVSLPGELANFRPSFLLESIPEILEVKKAHYDIFRKSYPDIKIRSVTSGFPESELGVGIAHPAFPHEINKVWEIVESDTSSITQLLWALGMIPVPVSDHWSFVLDVLFCGLTLAGLRYHGVSNMPLWKIDKYIRKLLGPNPFRAHDAIGAQGANFLTWSCLHHLCEKYGDLFMPAPELVERKDSGENWYPHDHFRPMVNWSIEGVENDEFESWILGPLFQMTGLMLHEKRSHLSHINAIGELCAQFRQGIPAVMREAGPEAVVSRIEAYHKLHPEAREGGAWHPGVFQGMDSPEWRQLYVNAEHDGIAGVLTISRESYNRDVDAELNRAIDWLVADGIENVIVTGDFHLSTQMVGADTSEFYPALEKAEEGVRVASGWSATARRLQNEFKISVGFVYGKRCLGGFLELLMHCRYFVAVEDAELGLPEVTLPVVPGMEGCHWPFRKTGREDWPNLLGLLLTGRSVKARDAVGWLVDYAGSLEDVLGTAWNIVTNRDHGISERAVEEGAMEAPEEIAGLPETGNPASEAARSAIFESVRNSCGTTLSDALTVQAKHSAGFMTTGFCRAGRIGAEFTKTMKV